MGLQTDPPEARSRHRQWTYQIANANWFQPIRRRGSGPWVDLLILFALTGLIFSEDIVIFFHLTILGILITTTLFDFRRFIVRAAIAGPIAAVSLYHAVSHGAIHDDELWEIPLMMVLVGVTYALKTQRDRIRRQLDESRHTIIAGVAHDIRNPLSSAMGFSQLMAAGAMSDDPDEMVEIAKAIESATREANEIVDDLLAAAQVDAGEMTVASERIDVPVIAESLADQYSRGARPIPVHIVDDGRKVECQGDELRVRQILRNLISNARRYGGPNVEIRLEPKGAHLSVCVVDDGSGVAESERETIFGAFSQGTQRVRTAESVGVGLAMARYLAELMGGSLTYRYEGGQSYFELLLPEAKELIGSR